MPNVFSPHICQSDIIKVCNSFAPHVDVYESFVFGIQVKDSRNIHTEKTSSRNFTQLLSKVRTHGQVEDCLTFGASQIISIILNNLKLLSICSNFDKS